MTEPVGAALSARVGVGDGGAAGNPSRAGASEAGQAIVVEVERLVTVIDSLPAPCGESAAAVGALDHAAASVVAGGS